MTHRLYHGDCLEVLKGLPEVKCIFADPPDNIGLDYDKYKDRLKSDRYIEWLRECVHAFSIKAEIVWMSFNAIHTGPMGRIFDEMVRENGFEAKYCTQTFTFGQHNHHDLGNNHRPLWRLSWPKAKLYPNSIRVPSWRQENGDKRADPRGRVPGDVFDFTRVTGNSKQRRPYHPTQLNEGLVERCILLSTKPGETVIDPFAGTGTTLRVCKPNGRNCTLIEMDGGYCKKIAEEHGMVKRKGGFYS